MVPAKLCVCIHAYIWGSIHTYIYIYTHGVHTKQVGKVLPSGFTPRASKPDPPLLKTEPTKQPHGAVKKVR